MDMKILMLLQATSCKTGLKEAPKDICKDISCWNVESQEHGGATSYEVLRWKGNIEIRKTKSLTITFLNLGESSATVLMKQ